MGEEKEERCTCMHYNRPAPRGALPGIRRGRRRISGGRSTRFLNGGKNRFQVN